MLLRDFLQRSLYGKASGYYSKSVVHRLAQPLKFRRYIGESDYRAALAAEYARSERAWLTPVEIFQPAYAEAIARHALVAHRRRFGASEPLNFLEIGGGTGTAATCILEFLQREAPDSFASCHYKILERTPQLAAAQRQRLSESFDEARWAVEETCAAEWAEAQPPQPGAWHVLALEVLDNLAYDKLRIIPTDGGAAELLEARVEQAGDRWVERYEPLSDAQLRHTASVLGLDSVDGVDALERALSVPPVRGPIGGALAGVRSLLSSVAGRSRSSAREVWVPTFCHRLLTAVAAAVPEHSMLLADFSWFPPQQRGAAAHVRRAHHVRRQRPAARVARRGAELFYQPGVEFGDAHLGFMYRGAARGAADLLRSTPPRRCVPKSADLGAMCSCVSRPQMDAFPQRSRVLRVRRKP